VFDVPTLTTSTEYPDTSIVPVPMNPQFIFWFVHWLHVLAPATTTATSAAVKDS
jgi:hypothetical protein